MITLIDLIKCFEKLLYVYNLKKIFYILLLGYN